MNKAVAALIRERAGNCCEYCRFPVSGSSAFFHLEHIIAKQHGGLSEADNLALACSICNLHKGPNLSGIDPLNGQTVELFRPRRQRWGEHFKWDGVSILPLSPQGRVTVHVLAMNSIAQIAKRERMLIEGYRFGDL